MIGIQEHRLFTTNPKEELWSEDRNWVFIYGSATNLRVGGVGFVISKPIYRCIQKVEVISERILHATFHGNPRLSITVVYAPTECGPSTAKDDFYASLAEHLEQLKRHDINLVVGNFNERIGTDGQTVTILTLKLSGGTVIVIRQMIMVRDWLTCAWSTTSVRHSLDLPFRLVGCGL